MRVKVVFSFILILTLTSIAYGDQTAITEDGRKVLLKDDGTWEYIKEAPNKSTKYHFRQTKWGMSKSAVKVAEKLDKVEENITEYPNGFAFKSSVANLQCFIHYYFTEDDKLALGVYDFAEEYTNSNKHIDDYNRIKSVLTKKYGKSFDLPEITWRKDLYRDDPSRYGRSVSLGYHTYMSKWDTNDTDIILFLGGDNFKVNLTVRYESKSFYKQFLKSFEKKDADDF